MLYLTVLSVAFALFFLSRFILLKKEIRSVTDQLLERHQHKADTKINLAFYDTDFEKLAKEINVQIDETKVANAQKRRTENELRQAILNMSHDIRTPMTSILGYIQFLENEDLTQEKSKEYIMIIKNGALRLKGLLEDFLELSMIESAEYSLKMDSIKLNDMVLEVLVGFYEEFNKKNIEPSINISENEVWIIGNSSAVKRVIENLTINAIKHSSGNVAINLNKTPSYAELTVINPAPELREEDLFYLFNRFYKADQARKGKGTGLGLSITKSLMQKMNGDITAELKDEQLYMKCKWKIKP